VKLKIVYGEHGKPDRYFVDGKPVTRRAFFRLAPEPVEAHHLVPSTYAGYPKKSDALAVHPNQVAEANERNKKHGIAVTYEEGTGMAVIPSRHEQKKLVRLEGCFNKDGGYGD
jgi:hypothetical protein